MTQSNEPTIYQQNEVIALFDGWKPLKRGHSTLYKKDGRVFLSIDFKYHTSWDWLMPLVEKIAELDGGKYNFHISSTGQWACYINRDDVFDSEICSYGGFEPVILNVFKAVYKFITWFNQQKQTNG